MGRAGFSSGSGMEGESVGVIVNQLKRLGASCDWSRERFTMDEGCRAPSSRCSSSCTARG